MMVEMMVERTFKRTAERRVGPVKLETAMCIDVSQSSKR
jgi:hypothetical protein